MSRLGVMNTGAEISLKSKSQCGSGFQPRRVLEPDCKSRVEAAPTKKDDLKSDILQLPQIPDTRHLTPETY